MPSYADDFSYTHQVIASPAYSWHPANINYESPESENKTKPKGLSENEMSIFLIIGLFMSISGFFIVQLLINFSLRR